MKRLFTLFPVLFLAAADLSAYAATAPTCPAQSMSEPECSVKIAHARCLISPNGGTSGTDIGQQALAKDVYPVCDPNQDELDGALLLGWCPCNGGGGPGFLPTYVYAHSEIWH